MNERFLQSDETERYRGFSRTIRPGTISCLLCSQEYEQGIIYPYENVLMDADKRMEKHIQEAHGSVFQALLEADKRHTGLTDVQKQVIRETAGGRKDKDAAAVLGVSEATVRGHRFKLKEKEKQAKAFLTMMQEWEGEAMTDVHSSATMVDERYAVTKKEEEKIIQTYFPEGTGGRISSFPRKEKRKLVVLRTIMADFPEQKTFTEKEVNEKLKQRWDDFVTLRRYLVEYGFLDRSRNGSEYWVKKSDT
ncbi:DUF2087 domain-containing protein [Alkalicoccus urumqiensis]|uniref:Transcriptional regulator n=1 Tax=Alkalicoccus urumqiensis TaxID=1548213 RepID=A0A2P6MIF6_ALKUR|nr:DUF2087 domain-containing protein [Alkalicoccus urumqiensis]PRO66047.1 transcriptional regulator [Alkalicoccus urumqiensis]